MCRSGSSPDPEMGGTGAAPQQTQRWGPQERLLAKPSDGGRRTGSSQDPEMGAVGLAPHQTQRGGPHSLCSLLFRLPVLQLWLFWEEIHLQFSWQIYEIAAHGVQCECLLLPIKVSVPAVTVRSTALAVISSAFPVIHVRSILRRVAKFPHAVRPFRAKVATLLEEIEAVVILKIFFRMW